MDITSISVSLLVLLSAPPTYSQGLRDLAIGVPCRTAFEAELARGSRPTRPLSEIEANDLVGFSGIHDGHQALIGFTCVDGFLTRQLIAFKLDTEAEAQAVFDRQYQALVDLFGTPCTDWRKLSFWQRFKLWINGVYFPDLLTGVDWDLGDDLHANLDTGPMGPRPDLWSVSVGISGPPEILVRNRDGSERRVHTPTVCLHGE